MINLEYIAGFFDADGSVGAYHRGENTYQVCVAIANSGKHGRIICEELRLRYDGAIVSVAKAKKETHRDVFWWRLNGGNKCKKFLEDIAPHVIIKKDQVLKAIEFIEECQKMPRYNKTQEQLNYMKQSVLDIKEMKRAC